MDSRDCFSHIQQRRQILRATVEVAAREPFASITVQAICDECGISRSTFYRNFPSVKGIAYWYQLYCATLGIYQIGRTMNVVEGHATSIRLLSELSPVFSDFVRNWDYDFSLPAVTTHVEAMREVLRERGEPVGTVVEYHLDGIARMAHHMVERWFNSGMDISVEELAEIIASQYPDGLRRIFDMPPTPRDPAQVASMLIGAAPC
ncbi:TetR/AcrR family transcriptional regulator [Eggerthellaceae bacterium 24-137]